MGKINYTIFNASALNASRLNMTGEAGKPGGGGGGYWPEGTPAAIRKSAVLWYDIALQGATNETMAEHPYLKDLTGNGHDMELRNFAWSGMSGIGGYNFIDLELWVKNTNVKLNVVTPNKVTILNGDANSKKGIRCGFLQNTSIKIKVEGSNINNPLAVYKLGDAEGDKLLQTITADNVYTIELEHVPNLPYQIVLFACNNITIEQLPIYSDALVTDGADDYGYVEGLPLLTKERGFTVMAVRKWLSEGIITALASKALTSEAWGGAFTFEGVEGGGTAPFNRAFNGANYVSYFAPSDFSFLTTHKYNDRNIAHIGDVEDNDLLTFFRLASDINSYYGKFVFYKFILFNRDLTDEEIDWVRVNIMKAYTVAELCAMGYGVETSYGYNMTGNFTEAGVPVPSDLAARLAGEDGKLLKVTNLKADAAFWEAVRAALKDITVPSESLPGYFQGTNVDGAVEMTVDAASGVATLPVFPDEGGGAEVSALTAGVVFSAEDMLNGSQITSLTLSGTGGYFSSGHWAFRRCGVVSVTTDTPILCMDCSGMYEWCGKLESPAPVKWGGRSVGATYPEGASNVEHMFDSCVALHEVPQFGDDRFADDNTLRPNRAYGFLGLSGVEVLGPVLDLRYINPADAAVCTLMFPSGDSLTDARLQNLNHGDWWLDGTAGPGGVSHGNLSGLDAASVEYLMANLWDLTTDKVGKNWRTTDNSWEMWTHEQTQELTDARAVVNFELTRTGVNANSWLRTVNALTDFKFRVTGLAEGDRLEFGAGVVDPSEASIYEDGEYVISKPDTLQGFKLYNDTETGTRVLTFEIVAPYDAGNHMVSSAKLHVPEAWRGKLTDAMLNAAAAKGWSVWIGDEELKAGGLDASLVDAWVFSGYKNEDAPESVAGENGNALELRNFAYTAESGFADGCIVTDGADDYGEALDIPVKKSYTMFVKYLCPGYVNLYTGVSSLVADVPGMGRKDVIAECYVYQTANNYPARAFYCGKYSACEKPRELTAVWLNNDSYNGKAWEDVSSEYEVPDGTIGYLRIGNTGTDYFLNSKIAYIAIYDKVMTQEDAEAEVAKLDALWEARKV